MIRHILMTADAGGNDWTYSLELARALAGHGARVSLSTSGGSISKEQRREAARVPGLAVYDVGFNLDWSEGFPKDLRKAADWMLTLEERLKPDIVHMNGFRYGPIAFRSPLVVAAHSDSEILPGPAESSDRVRFRSEMCAVLDLANLLVAPTYALLERLKAVYQVQTPTRVIPYFRRNSDYRNSPKQKFVFSAGRNTNSASEHSIIETAAGELDWPVITASGAAITLKSAEQMSKAAIYCLTSQSEASDVPVLEGALSRCALVIGDVPNLRENWNNCALFVPPGDSELLKKNLQTLIVDQDLREELAQRAYARAKEFSPERCIDDYLDAYQSAWSNKYKSSRNPR